MAQSHPTTSRVTLELLDKLDRTVLHSTLKRRQSLDFPVCSPNDQAGDWQTCFPTNETSIIEGQWTRLVFNPDFSGFNSTEYIDIYLFEDSVQKLVKLWPAVNRAQGQVAIEANERWWPPETSWPVNQNLTFNYYFILKPANTSLSTTDSKGPLFSAIQTAPPSSLSASAASAASSFSVASSLSNAAFLSTGSVVLTDKRSSRTVAASSLVTLSLSGQPTTTLPAASVAGYESALASRSKASSASASSATGNLQVAGRSGSSLPNWAIGVIAALGAVLLIVTLLAVLLLLCRHHHYRRRRSKERLEAPAKAPMLPQLEKSGPLMAATTGSVRPPSPGENHALLSDPREETASPDNARTLDTTITSAEAASMAQAYRDVLRKPSFHNSDSDHSHGSSLTPEHSPAVPLDATHIGQRSSVLLPKLEQAQQLMSTELASAGQSVRQVHSHKPAVHNAL